MVGRKSQEQIDYSAFYLSTLVFLLWFGGNCFPP